MNDKAIEEAVMAAFNVMPSNKACKEVFSLEAEEVNALLFKATGHIETDEEQRQYDAAIKKIVELIKTDPLRYATPCIEQMEQFDREVGSRMTRNNRIYDHMHQVYIDVLKGLIT